MKNEELRTMIEEEEENKEFEEWANNEVAFFPNLSEEEKQQLKSDYRQAIIWKKTYNDTMTQALNHMGGSIDYSTDISKTGEKMENASNKLNQTLANFNEKYGNIRNR